MEATEGSEFTGRCGVRHLSRRLALYLLAMYSAYALFSQPAVALDKGQQAAVRSSQAEAILFYGQSNAGAGGHAKPVLTSSVFPDRVFSFKTSRQIYGAKLFEAAQLSGTGPLQDDARYPPFPAVAMAYALAHNRPDHNYFFHTVWYGGQPLMSFLNGTTSWSDLMAVAGRMPQALAGRGLAGRVAALVLIQGEAGPAEREAYGRMLDGFLNDSLPALKTTAGQNQNPLAILLQTNTSNAQSGTLAGVPLAQWDVARRRPGDTVLAGPMYQFPLDDTVHQSTEGRLMLGDLLAVVYDARVGRGEAFEPLHPTRARLDGGRIILSFQRPKDALPLQWDRDWVAAVPNYGFVFEDEQASTGIDHVEISGPSEVTLHLDKRPSGKRMIVRYAMEQPKVPGWAPGRGQLMAPTTRLSAFAGFGLHIPETVAHYAIRFEMAVE